LLSWNKQAKTQALNICHILSYKTTCIQGVPEWSVQTLWISSRDLNKQKMSHKHGVGNACFWSYNGSKFSCNSWRNYHVKSHRCYKTVFIYFLGFATDITGQYTCYSKYSKWPPLDSKEACARRRIVWGTVYFHRHDHTPDGYLPVHQNGFFNQPNSVKHVNKKRFLYPPNSVKHVNKPAWTSNSAAQRLIVWKYPAIAKLVSRPTLKTWMNQIIHLMNWRISIWCMAVPVEMNGSPDNAATCAGFLGI